MVLISVRFASRDAGFILKLPPTKNWRDMVVGGGLWGGVGMLECYRLAFVGISDGSDVSASDYRHTSAHAI